MLRENLAKQEYWDEAYSTCSLSCARVNDPVKLLLEKYLPNGPGECYEIGCFPGRYLPTLGAKGFRLSGIDLTPRVEGDLPHWLKRGGFKVGTFTRGDFLACESKARYDVVCSFGFIEHFANFTELLRMHARLVKERGVLVVTTPNFAGGIQRLLHRTLDSENLLRHNLAAMNPRHWADAIAPDGFTPTFCGPFGRFAFWADREARGTIQQAAVSAAVGMGKRLSRLPIPDSKLYSPYCGIVAVRA